MAARVGDHARLLQDAGGEAHGGASRTEHLTEELLRQRHDGVADAVVTHQKPAREAFFDSMQPVAGGDLGGLKSETGCKALHLKLEFWTLRKRTTENVNGNAVGGSVPLRHNAGRASSEAEDDGNADESFLADESDFDHFAIGLHSEHGCHSVIQEIHGADRLSRINNDLVKVQSDKFEHRNEEGTFFLSDVLENEIADFSFTAVLAFGASWGEGINHKRVAFRAKFGTGPELRSQVIGRVGRHHDGALSEGDPQSIAG